MSQDAASLSVTILKKKLRGRIYLACDNHPVSRQEVMGLVDKRGQCDKKFEALTGTSDPLGKKLNNLKTRKELGAASRSAMFGGVLIALIEGARIMLNKLLSQPQMPIMIEEPPPNVASMPGYSTGQLPNQTPSPSSSDSSSASSSWF